MGETGATREWEAEEILIPDKAGETPIQGRVEAEEMGAGGVEARTNPATWILGRCGI